MTEPSLRCLVYDQATGFTTTTLEALKLPTFQDVGDTDEAWLRAAGFMPHGEGFSSDLGYGFAIHERDGAATHDLTGVCFYDRPSRCEIVFLRSAGDHVALELALAPLVVAQKLATLSHVLLEDDNGEDLLGKLFRLSHGHEPHDVCHECHPREWDTRQRLKRERVARQAADAETRP